MKRVIDSNDNVRKSTLEKFLEMSRDLNIDVEIRSEPLSPDDPDYSRAINLDWEDIVGYKK